jgi:hypothetical protein
MLETLCRTCFRETPRGKIGSTDFRIRDSKIHCYPALLGTQRHTSNWEWDTMRCHFTSRELGLKNACKTSPAPLRSAGSRDPEHSSRPCKRSRLMDI